MPFILPARTLSAEYNIDNSCRFDNNVHFTRTPSSDGNLRTFTFSWWCKVSSVNSERTTIYSAAPEDTGDDGSYIWIDDQLTIREYDGSTNKLDIVTNRIFRDPSAWYHIVVAVDTTQGTASNRIKIYVNGAQETSLGTATYPDQNYDYNHTNKAQLQRIGRNNNSYNYPFNGYIAEFHFIDGSQKSASDFGEYDTDSGIWKPKQLGGSYGTNGYKLEFKQTGTSADASGKGADTSGNGHHWDDHNTTVTSIVTDSPTNNFATFNPLQASLPTNAIRQGLENGLLKSWTSSNDNSADYRQWSSIAIPHTNKWFVETYWSRNQNDHTKGRIGILAYHDDVTHGVVLKGDMGKIVNGSASSYASGSMAYGDIFGALYDLPNNQVTFYSNGTSLGAISWTPNANYIYYHVVYADSQSLEFYGNFGNPIQTISSGNTDPEGFGNFEHSTNNGYALCTKNLGEYG